MKLHFASILLSTLPAVAIAGLRGAGNGNSDGMESYFEHFDVHGNDGDNSNSKGRGVDNANGNGSGSPESEDAPTIYGIPDVGEFDLPPPEAANPADDQDNDNYDDMILYYEHFSVHGNGGDTSNSQGRDNGNSNGNSNGGGNRIPGIPEKEDESDLPPPEVTDPAEDLEAIADAIGLSPDGASELLKQQESFANLIELLQEDNNFLQAEMPSTPDGEYVIKYKNGNVPPKRDDDIEQFKARNLAKVKMEKSKLSLKDAEGRGMRLISKLERKGYSNVSYFIDGDGIDIVAKKSSNHDKNQDKGKVPLSRAAEILDLPTDDSDLEEFALTLTEHDDHDPVTPDHTYGGRQIRSNSSQCTTAFSVVANSGGTGIATAAHCTGMNRYDAVSPEGDYSTVFQREHKGWYGDMEWHRTSHLDLPEYYARPNTRWPVRSVGSSISKGQVVCAYSRMTGTRRCDRVAATSISVQYSGLPRMHNIVMMEGAVMIGGDSGGPWSYSDRAFGIHSGTRTTNGVRQNMWSRVSNLPSALGVRVRTQ